MVKMIGNRKRVLFLVSCAVLVFAILMAAVGLPKIVQEQIHKNIQLEKGSAMFDKWRRLPMPLDFKVYLFNVTNPEEVNKGYKPNLNEVGPYVYEEHREKTIIDYGENDTLTYMLKKTFRFNHEKSGSLSEDDLITVINIPYLAAVVTVADIMPGMVPMVNSAMEVFFENLTDPFLRTRVGDLLFDGIFLTCNSDNSALKLVCARLRSQKPATMRPAENRTGFYFSMFSHLNLTETGPFRVVRGRQDINEVGHIVGYKEKSEMDVWGDPFCGKINGTDATSFPPISSRRVPERLYIFEPEVCRSLFASLVGERTLFNLTAYYYEVDRMTLAAKSAEPANKCFCKENWSAKHDGCLLMGVLNLSPCQGVPVVASFPHFYLASEELLDFFDGGVQPEADKHKTFMYLEPVTGAVIKGAQRLQFNVELRTLKNIPQLENVPTGLFPMLWIEEGAEINLALRKELRRTHVMLTYVEVTMYIVLAMAIGFSIWATTSLVRSRGLAALWSRRNNSVSFIMQPSPGSVEKPVG